MISEELLVRYYVDKKLSVADIAKRLGYSQGKINYWLKKFKIQKRTISDAIYEKWNPLGDPFTVQKPLTVNDAILLGLGIGLYWGEGTKSNRTSVRLGNSDPRLIKKFIEFLTKLYNIDRTKLRFGLQIFSDMNSGQVLGFWRDNLGVRRDQFYKVIVTPYRGVGNYRKKTKHGVLTVYFNNKKLRDILCNAIDEMAK